MDKDSMKFLNDLKLIIKRSIGIVIAILIVIAIASDGWFTVSEQENAVIVTAGKFTSVSEAGLHFKIPFIQKVRKVNMTTRSMEIGYKSESGGLVEYSDESMMITNDFNIVSVDFYVEWKVTDPVKVLFNVERPESLLRNVIQSSARDVVSTYGIDSVLTDGKSEIQGNVRELVNNTLDKYDMGVMVTTIIIQDAEPPDENVLLAFKAVENAKQKKETLLNEANKYYNENIPNARAEADKIIKEAEAIKESRINEANGQVARFNEVFAEYIINPEITKTRMYLEAIEEILPSLKVYMDGTNGNGLLKMMDITK